MRTFSVVWAMLSLAAMLCRGEQPKIVWSAQEKPIMERLRGLRGLPDEQRPGATKQLALDIRQLSPGEHKARLAETLANLATEGDPGSATLREVAATLAQSLREQPPPAKDGEIPMSYLTLAQLVRYEHVQASLDDPRFTAAMARLEADDAARRSADFTLTDLHGKQWSLKDLRGKVVVVNFWATWCPPCRKEMPDLQALYERFGPRGLVILAISDETAETVTPFIAEHRFSYPILLDPGRKVNELFRIEGIPKTFVYDREGKLAAEAIDMRTRSQFLEMLAHAGFE